jgi:predicted RNase H-like HicB family nuclease
MADYIALTEIDEEAGAFAVWFPDLPGCTAMGATVEQAFANAAEAMRDWAEATLGKGGTLPQPRAIEELLAEPEISEAIGEGAPYQSIPLVRKANHLA